MLGLKEFNELYGEYHSSSAKLFEAYQRYLKRERKRQSPVETLVLGLEMNEGLKSYLFGIRLRDHERCFILARSDDFKDILNCAKTYRGSGFGVDPLAEGLEGLSQEEDLLFNSSLLECITMDGSTPEQVASEYLKEYAA